MLTLRRTVLEKSTAINNWLDNCGKRGTATLNCHTVEAFLKKYEISQGEFIDLIHNEYSFYIVFNENHYIASRSELYIASRSELRKIL